MGESKHAIAFKRRLFEYLTTIVPFWRVCADDAWPLDDDAHLLGIGVLRNYGGDVMVVPWSGDAGLLGALKRPRAGRAAANDDRVVVVDDLQCEDWQAVVAAVHPIGVVRWTERQNLADFVVHDAPPAKHAGQSSE